MKGLQLNYSASYVKIPESGDCKEVMDRSLQINGNYKYCQGTKICRQSFQACLIVRMNSISFFIIWVHLSLNKNGTIHELSSSHFLIWTNDGFFFKITRSIIRRVLCKPFNLVAWDLHLMTREAMWFFCTLAVESEEQRQEKVISYLLL